MNAIGNLLICGLLQVTIVAGFALTATLIGGRWSRSWAASLACWSLCCIMLLTVLAIIPLPSWFDQAANLGSATSAQGPADNAAKLTSEKSNPPLLATQPERIDWSGVWSASIEGIRNFNAPDSEANNAAATTAAVTSSMKSWLVYFFVGSFTIGIAFGLLRLAGGMLGVWLLVRSSRPLQQSKIAELIDVMRAEMGCLSKIEVRECREVTTAAVVGWRKPVLLISENWKSWSNEQLRSVVAHEVAHISRDDYIATLIAQFGLVLHFYHPLVHWLVNQMRLEQELAADTLAAQVVGGPQIYLKAIGELALSQPKEQVSWPVHTFLPTRKTFLRRIEMLRDMTKTSDRVPSALRIGSLAMLAGVGLAAVGLRPSVGVDPLNLQAESPFNPALANTTIAAVADEKFEPKFVPADAAVVVMLRPEVLIAEYKKAATRAKMPLDKINDNPLIPQGCKLITIVAQQLADGSGAAVVMVHDTKANRDIAAKKLLGNASTVKEKILLAEVEVAGNEALYYVDDTTIIYGSKDWVMQMVVTGPVSRSALTKSPAWEAASDATVVASMNKDALVTPVLPKMLGPAYALISPIIANTVGHTLSLRTADSMKLKWVMSSEKEESAKIVEESVSSIKTVMDAMIESQGQRSNDNALALGFAKKLLGATKIVQKGSQIELTMEGDAATTADGMIAIFAPALTASRSAAQRTAQANNLKQVMLALHNYHDAHGHFPPAVTIDKDSGVARSWRVEILPYLEEAALYEAYRKNEPWDSEANKIVLAKMPSIFRHPSQPSDSTFASIYASYGKGMMFEKGDKAGTKLRDITDGTSNTIAIVEAKRDIPWTKPEDIEIDATAKELPEFGFVPEGWQTGFGDGSVRFISKSIDVELYLKLLTRAGGEVVQ
jgi:beta-lactamase regulating signal transducer with metallopeptidase domain